MSQGDDSTQNDNQRTFASFVKQTLRQRECNAFIESEKEERMCQCGREFKWHDDQGISTLKDVSWDHVAHTVLNECSCFGSTPVSASEKDAGKSPAKYVRVEHLTKSKDLWTLMVTHWKLPRPNMLISVTGGVKDSLDSQLKESFTNGLMNVATSTGAWIVTGGTDTGIMALMGEAVRDYGMRAGAEDSNVVCIGFATWGAIKDRDRLEQTKIESQTMQQNEASTQNGKESGKSANEGGSDSVKYQCDNIKTVEDLCSLNHTHFILADDGTVNKFGAEVDLRVAMERFVTNRNISFEPECEGDAHVPVVLLVVSGDVNTLETVLHGLKNNTQVVVIGSSGGAADFIKEAMELTKNEQNEDEATIPSNFKEAVNNIAHIQLKVSIDDSDRLKKCLDSIRKIVDKPFRQLVNAVNLYREDESASLETAIMDVVMKAHKSHAHEQTQLELLFAWDKSDIAREKIFKKQPRPHNIEVSVLHRLMYPALIQGRVEFVKLFMENGAKFDDYLTPAELARLYKAFLSKTQESNNDACRMLRTMINKMLDKKKYEISHGNVLLAVGRVLDDLMGAEFKFHVYSEKLAKAEAKATKEFNPHKELFLWSLLLNRMDMATLFWRKGKDHIGGALVGCSLCRHLRDKANSKDYIYLASDMDAQADRFEQLAIKVLGNCYQRDKDVTHKLLVRKLHSWQDRTLLSIAGGEKQMDFLGHTACRTKLNNIWRGNITAYTTKFKILCALFLPLLIWTIRFKNDPDDDPNVANENRCGNTQVSPIIEQLPEVDSKSTKEQQPSFDKRRRMWNAPIYFYTSPIVKFSCDVIFQLVYRALFSYFVLVDLHPINNDLHRASPAHTEFAVWVWTLTLFAEQIRKIWIQEPLSLVSRLKYYFESYWAYFDTLVCFMFFTSIILRCVLQGENFMWARILYCVTLSLFYIRCMYFFYVGSLIGPKVIMIGQMMTDLLLFVSLWVIFLLSYGVMMEALRLPGYDNSWARLKRIVYYPYWQMYNVIDSNIQSGVYDACGNATDPDNISAECQQSSNVIMIICAVYSLLTAILLLNLLIAMFNSTFGKVQDHSWGVWSFYRYKLIYDYFERPTLGPPLSIVYIWRCAYYCYRKNKIDECSLYDPSNVVDSYRPYGFHFTLSPEEYRQLTAFERSSMEKVMLEEERKPDATLDSSSSSDSVVELRQQLNELKNHLQSQEKQLTYIVNLLKSPVESLSNKQSK